MRGKKNTSKYNTETLLELRNQGLSLRQIGQMLGMDHSQIRRQLISDVKGIKLEKAPIIDKTAMEPVYGTCITYTMPLEVLWEKYGKPGANKTRKTDVWTNNWGSRFRGWEDEQRGI